MCVFGFVSYVIAVVYLCACVRKLVTASWFVQVSWRCVFVSCLADGRPCRLWKKEVFYHQNLLLLFVCVSLFPLVVVLSFSVSLWRRWRFPPRRWLTFLCTLWASTALQRARDTKAKSISESVCPQSQPWVHNGDLEHTRPRPPRVTQTFGVLLRLFGLRQELNTRTDIDRYSTDINNSINHQISKKTDKIRKD